MEAFIVSTIGIILGGTVAFAALVPFDSAVTGSALPSVPSAVGVALAFTIVALVTAGSLLPDADRVPDAPDRRDLASELIERQRSVWLRSAQLPARSAKNVRPSHRMRPQMVCDPRWNDLARNPRPAA